MAGLLDMFGSDSSPMDPRMMGLLGALSAYGSANPPQAASRLPLAKPSIGYQLSQALGGYGQGYGFGLQQQHQFTKNQLDNMTLQGYQRLQGAMGGATPPTKQGVMAGNIAGPEGGYFPGQSPQQFAQGTFGDRTMSGEAGTFGPGTVNPATGADQFGTRVSGGTPQAGGVKPLFNVADLKQQYVIAASTPGMQQVAAGLLGAIQKGAPEGMYVGEDGGIYNRPGRVAAETDVEYGKSFGTNLPKTQFDIAEKWNSPQKLGPSDQLINPGGAPLPQFQLPSGVSSGMAAQPPAPGGTPRAMYTNPLSPAQVAVNLGGEPEFVKAQGSGLGKEAVELVQSQGRSQQQIATLGHARQLVEQWKAAGGQQGQLAPLQAAASSYLQSVGMSPETLGLPKDAGPAQALDAVSKKLALGQIGPGGLPANNFSEADRKFVQGIPGSITDTPEGWEAKIGMAEKIEQRNNEKVNMWLNWEDHTQAGYLKFLKAWNDHVNNSPLFSPEEQQAILARVGKKTTAPSMPRQVKVVNGVTYHQDDKGNWYPQ